MENLGFWIFMRVCVMLIPVSLTVFGARFRKNPPTDINCMYGYRSSMSMKNRATWNFAHLYWGQLCQKTGSVVLVLSLAVLAVTIGKKDSVIGNTGLAVEAAQILWMLWTIYMTERALKRRFDKDGNPRSDTGL